MFTQISPAALDQSCELREALLALNNDHAVELSWLDEARLKHLVSSAFVAERVGLADAMLIAFDQSADYDSPNFLWFRDRFSNFAYVDRIVTAAAARGRGLARKLYLSLVERARAAGHVRIVCEVNSNPPNPASEAFHQSFGFLSIGSALLANSKLVTYMELPIKSTL